MKLLLHELRAVASDDSLKVINVLYAFCASHIAQKRNKSIAIVFSYGMCHTIMLLSFVKLSIKSNCDAESSLVIMSTEISQGSVVMRHWHSQCPCYFVIFKSKMEFQS